jgi:hypothetical protein
LTFVPSAWFRPHGISMFNERDVSFQESNISSEMICLILIKASLTLQKNVSRSRNRLTARRCFIWLNSGSSSDVSEWRLATCTSHFRWNVWFELNADMSMCSLLMRQCRQYFS